MQLPLYIWHQRKAESLKINSVGRCPTASYIDNQHEHHKKTTFQVELLAFLKKYNVEYDERYLWE